MVATDGDGRVLFCSPAQHGSCADITHSSQLGLVRLLADGPAVEILADAGYQGLGAPSGGRVVTPPHHRFKKNARGAARRCTNSSARRIPGARPRPARTRCVHEGDDASAKAASNPLFISGTTRQFHALRRRSAPGPKPPASLTKNIEAHRPRNGRQYGGRPLRAGAVGGAARSFGPVQDGGVLETARAHFAGLFNAPHTAHDRVVAQGQQDGADAMGLGVAGGRRSPASGQSLSWVKDTGTVSRISFTCRALASPARSRSSSPCSVLASRSSRLPRSASTGRIRRYETRGSSE
ncbi:hypothetical protein ABZY14_39980 [Streptomyces sp. NPDC006617]|uniref:hypothetical protein n=1 Tax=Streptomyces sp. NPDC006617 TaxID=3155354 RepID=UPI0033A24DB1